MVGDENDEPRRRGRDDDLGIDNDDGDAGEQKRTRQARQHEYEEDERFGDLADLEDNIERLAQEDDEDEEALDIDPAQKAATDAQADSLADMFKVQAKWASSFSFDTINGKSAQFDLHFPASSPKLLLVDLIERCCRASVIHEVASVGKCARFFTDKGVFTRTLETEGCNLHGMWAMADEHIDLDKIKTNDIYAILKTYGVEAARQAIITEMSNVFGPYGIKVDYRHLTVVADYMVRIEHLLHTVAKTARWLTDNADTCRRIQTLQPIRYLAQILTTAQGVFRNDCCFLVGSNAARRL